MAGAGGQRGFRCGTAGGDRSKPLDPKRGAMPSSRRRLLRAVGASATAGVLAGCTRLNLRRPEATPTADPPDGFWRWTSVEAVDGPPDEYDVGWAVRVVQPWGTADRSPRVAFTVTNGADERRAVGPAFPGDATAAGGGLFLRDEPDGDETFGVWCIDDDGKRDGRAGDSGEGPRGPHRLDPGASVTLPVVVRDDREQRGCLSPGIYDFDVGQVVPYIGERDGEREYYEVTVSLGVRGEN